MAKKTYKDRDFKFETLQLHVGQESADPVTDARAVPIYQTSSFVFHNSQHAADRFGLKDAGNIYGRLTNPTVDIFEQRVAALEGGVAALATASGAAAVTYAIQNVALAGDHIVAAKNIYGGTYNLLAHTLVDYGVETTFVDPLKPEEFEAAIKENTKALYIEALGNPNSEVTDIEAVAEIAHKHNIPLLIDNTFGTPYLIRPIEYGDPGSRAACKHPLFPLRQVYCGHCFLVPQLRPDDLGHLPCSLPEYLQALSGEQTLLLDAGSGEGSQEPLFSLPPLSPDRPRPPG